MRNGMVDSLWGDFVEKADPGRVGGPPTAHCRPGGFGCPHRRQVPVSGPGWPSQGELEGRVGRASGRERRLVSGSAQ